MSLIDTIGNEDWLKENEPAIKQLLPKTWTHMQNISALTIGFNLKLLGVEWFSEEEFGRIMVYFERVGLMERDGYTVRANPISIFE